MLQTGIEPGVNVKAWHLTVTLLSTWQTVTVAYDAGMPS